MVDYKLQRALYQNLSIIDCFYTTTKILEEKNEIVLELTNGGYLVKVNWSEDIGFTILAYEV